jgi:hypothetical protein
MKRREFIGKIAASFVVVQGLYLLNGCTNAKGENASIADDIDTADLAKVSDALQHKFTILLQWLKEKGWGEYLLATTGLDLDKCCCDQVELVRKLDKLPLKDNGFDDFAGVRGIQPGLPALSLLYHAMASARVKPKDKKGNAFPDDAYPSVEQLDVLENYIYALHPFSLTEADLKENYVLAVFAYEYRPAFKTPHHAHADLVFSRTGVARIGEHEYNYDKQNRIFTNAPVDKSKTKEIAVTAARYGLFLAKVIEGKNADVFENDKVTRKGEVTLLGTVTDKASGDLIDDQRYFLQPVRKIFQDDLLIDEQPLHFSEYHKTEKLYRLVADADHKLNIDPADDLDINKAPFIVESKLSTLDGQAESALVVLMSKGSSVLVSSKKSKLIRPAMQNGKRLRFEIPKIWTDPKDIDKSNRYFTTFNSQNLVEDIEILAGDTKVKKRNPNQFNNPRNTPLYLNIRYEDKNGDEVFEHYDNAEDIDNDHWAAVFEDSICDGQVAAETGAWTSKILPAELFKTCLPAFSIVTAPDFFPQVDSFDLLKYDINVERNQGEESNFYEGGLPSLSAGRIRPNPNTLQFPSFNNENKKELNYTYTSVLSNSALSGFSGRAEFKDPARRDYTSSSFLPDVCSYVFAPGWDVTYCADAPVSPEDNLAERKKKSYLSTRGLGSPFPEDMKLCAAVNGMWPAASPDAARTFQGSLDLIDRNPTAIPLMDMEIGIYKSSPALTNKKPLLDKETFGWDGEQGPCLQKDPDGKANFVVNFTDLCKADYLENLTNPKLQGFDMSQLRELTSAELVARMEALRQCIKCLPGTPFKKELTDNNLVAYTRMWLVSAEKVNDWSAGAKGFGIPDDLFENGVTEATTAKTNIKGPGYLYVFVNTIKEDDLEHIHWDKHNPKRRWQTCETIYVCQVTETTIAFCTLKGNPPDSKNIQWTESSCKL